MSDIVELLRASRAEWTNADDLARGVPTQLESEAADVIERLQVRLSESERTFGSTTFAKELQDKLASALEERDVLDGVNRKGDEVIVDLTLKLDRLVEVLKVTAGNIRSLGPAGQLPEPYRPWLQAVESAIEEGSAHCLEPIQ